MKNYFCRSCLRGLIIALFCAMLTKSYALSFNEPRRVIIPQYANAVYRDLTVLDKMYLEVRSDRVFLLELGKRPSYFWDNSKMYYLYQVQALNLESIFYNNSSDISNIFTIRNITLRNEGSFASKNLFFAKNSTIQASRNSNLLVNYVDNFPAQLTFTSSIVQYDIYARNLSYVSGSLYDTTPMIADSMYLRDVQFNGVKFPSPRLMVYQNGSGYHAKGTALNFEKSDLSGPNVSYYGPWELWGPSGNKGVLYPSTSSNDPCGGNTPCRCHQVQVTCSASKGVTPPGCSEGVVINMDTNSTIYMCGNKKYVSNTTGIFDPIDFGGECPNFCYDYQVVNIAPNSNTTATENYNNNQAYFEFKVEEVFQVWQSSATLISQKPKTRIDPNAVVNNIIPISKWNSGAFVLNNLSNPALQRFKIDNTDKVYTVFGNPIIYAGEKNPCLEACKGKLCLDNYVYVRKIETRELRGGTDSGASSWPVQEGEKQNLVLRTYTLGFCPEQKTNTYGQFEDNYDLGDISNLIEAMLIKSDSNWTNAKVCMRRKVKCNQLEETFYLRSYQPLTTDY